MPVDSIASARDAIYGIITTAWNTITPTIPELLYDDVHEDMPEGPDPWALAQVFNLDNSETTLVSAAGSKRFKTRGRAVVTIYTSRGGGRVLADEYSQIVVDALRGKATGADKVIFRNVVATEDPRPGSWAVTIVLADFEYDELN
jgi:hypothetical protein